MTPEEKQTMRILAETTKAEINMMCITDDLYELNFMAIVVKNNVDKLRDMREPYLTVAEFERDK